MKSAALVLVGVWLGALMASWVAATVNFRTVDRVLGAEARPELAQKLEPVPVEARRQALRHLAAELNRWMFRWWSLAQVVLGVLLVGLCWRLPGAARYLFMGALLVVLGQVALVRPIVDLGRSIDFVPRPLPPEVGRRFGLLHTAFAGTDLVKAALLAVSTFLLGRR
jgi:hypothetical protein